MTENTTASGAADTTYKLGNEFLPFHPSASHIEPAYRDGWNACYKAAIAASAPVAPTQLLEAVDAVLETAPCDCSHKRRYEDGEHLSGCHLFDLNLVRGRMLVTTEAAPVAPPQQGEYPEPQQDSDDPASLGAYLAAWAGGVHSRTKNDTGAAEEWISVSVERLGHAAAALIAARGAAQAAPAEIDAKSFQSYAETRAYSKGYYAGKKAAQAAPAPVAEDAEDAARYRWLRDVHIGDEPESINLQRAVLRGLDSAIDAARAQSAQPEGGAK